MMERQEGREGDLLQGAFLDNYIPHSLPLFCSTAHSTSAPPHASGTTLKTNSQTAWTIWYALCAKGIGAVIMAKVLKMVVVFQAQVSLGYVQVPGKPTGRSGDTGKLQQKQQLFGQWINASSANIECLLNKGETRGLDACSTSFSVKWLSSNLAHQIIKNID